MTSRERIEAALNHREPDCVPMWTIVDNVDVLRHFAPPDFDFSQLEQAHPWDAIMEVSRAALRGLGIEGTFLCGMGPINPFPRHVAENKTVGSDSTKHLTIDDLKTIRPELPRREDIEPEYLELHRKAVAALEPDVIVANQEDIGMGHAIGAIGMELFCVAIHEAPVELSRIIEEYSELDNLKCRICAEHKLNFVWQVGGDIAHKTGTFFSPDFLRREYFPRLKRQLLPLKEAGIKVIYHTDGNVMEVIDDLIDAGIDALNPIETTAGMDLAALKKRYGKNLAFVGNVDANVMTFGTPEDVEKEVRRCIDSAASGGGLLADTGAGEIAPGYKFENVIRMCEAFHEMR
jgi:hypothetical protein